MWIPRMQTFKETKTRWAKTFNHKIAHMISKGSITTSHVVVILISDSNKPSNICWWRATPIVGLKIHRTETETTIAFMNHVRPIIKTNIKPVVSESTINISHILITASGFNEK